MTEIIGAIIIIITLAFEGLGSVFSTSDKITKREQVFSVISTIMLTVGIGLLIFSSDSGGWSGVIETGFNMFMLLLVGIIWFTEGELKQLYKRYFESKRYENKS